jgi:hypothetical protein
MAFLLPYIEQDNLYRCFGGVSVALGDGSVRNVLARGITDGTSNTILMGELFDPAATDLLGSARRLVGELPADVTNRLACSGTPTNASDDTLRLTITAALNAMKGTLQFGAGNETFVPNLYFLPTLGTAGTLLVNLAEPLFGREPSAGDIATGGFAGLCDLTTILVRTGDERIARGLCKTLATAEQASEKGKPDRVFKALESYRKKLGKATEKGAYDANENGFLFSNSFFLNPEGFPPP